MTEHVGAAPYESAESLKGHRNGHKPRALEDEGGHPEPARPPGPRGNLLDSLVRPLPAQREGASVWPLMEMYVEGVSTRKVKDITEALCGTSFSKSLVSSFGRSPWMPELRSLEGAPAGGNGLPLPLRGRPLREGAGRASDREPGSPHSLGGAGRRLQGDSGRAGRGHRERSHLPRFVPLPKSPGGSRASSLWSPTTMRA